MQALKMQRIVLHKNVLIARKGFEVIENFLEEGRCPKVQTPLTGVFDEY